MLIITRYISRELVHMVMKIKESHGLTRSLTHRLEHIGPSAYLMLTCVVELFIQSSDTAAKVFQQCLTETPGDYTLLTVKVSFAPVS